MHNKITLEIVNYVYVQSQISEKRIGTPSKIMNRCQKYLIKHNSQIVKFDDFIKQKTGKIKSVSLYCSPSEIQHFSCLQIFLNNNNALHDITTSAV